MMMAATALLAPGGVAALPDGEAPIVEASHAADLAAAAPILLTDEDDAAAAAAADSGDDDEMDPARRNLNWASYGSSYSSGYSNSYGSSSYTSPWGGSSTNSWGQSDGYTNANSWGYNPWGRKLQEAFTNADARGHRKLQFISGFVEAMAGPPLAAIQGLTDTWDTVCTWLPGDLQASGGC
eukprot:CAMPEP_0197493204 /NCGR_PEP_ID=MMETSP1311-20131121/20061_1 /TAXON_ID=464262 /ORGANISM="Genus nov. species nov., Strain RCC856" /LENGTH=180 /DNA_ID=CAMNT_0043038407 /DNA_START=282 /DNA_END=824 /DNA_ORIENTATION=+